MSCYDAPFEPMNPGRGRDGRAPPIVASRRAFLKHCLRASAALGCAAAGLGVAEPARANDLKLGEPAPPLLLIALDGRHISTRSLLGKVVIATFWATWCEPCIAEMPILSAYAAEHAADGLEVLGFSLDSGEDLEKVRRFAQNLRFPVGLLGSPWAGGYGRIWRCPVSFVIDRSGRLVHDGWDDSEPAWTRERLQQIVDPVLANKASLRELRPEAAGAGQASGSTADRRQTPPETAAGAGVNREQG